ncbi:MAG: hypothetical protein R2867_23835 [Caldilineaceae bacterium]
MGVGTFPVQRGCQRLGAIQAAERLINDGHAVGMFPEHPQPRWSG